MPTSRTDDLPKHPIGVVAERTGLSVHVLRAWERRYGVVRPRRGESGRRLYSDADVDRLALLHSATRSGRAVASIVSLSAERLRKMVAEDAALARERPAGPTPHREEAVRAVRALEPERLGALLRRSLLSLGAVAFLEEVVAPLMTQVGGEWHDGRITIAQEHAATAAVTQALGELIRDLEVPDAAPRVVIATPLGERHAVGAMMAAAAASHDGWRVTWLGADLPAAQIAAAAKHGGAHVVALSVAGEPAGLGDELRTLRRELDPHVSLMVGGAGAPGLSDLDGLTKVRDLPHWRALLRRCAAKAPE